MNDSFICGERRQLREYMAIGKIVLLFAVLGLLLIAFGAVIGYFLGNAFLLMSVMFLIAIVLNVVSYYKCDSIAIKTTHTKLIKESDNPRLYKIVKKVSDMAGIPMPKVGIMPSKVPNAFATGRDEKHAVVVATEGILSMLDDDELEAVIGHEISHITHKDVLVSTMAATIAMIISYIGSMVLFSEIFGGLDNRNSNNSILLLVAAILIPIGATFVQLGISRSRESYADEGSVRLVREPDPLISALKKISSPAAGTSNRAIFRNPSNTTRTPKPNAYSSLFIVNNFGSSALLNLFSTHPPIQKRIENIERIKAELGL